MRKSILSFLVLVLILGIGLHHVAGLTELQHETVEEAIDATRSAARAMKVLEPLKWVARIGKVAGPIFVVVSLELDIVQFFVTVESPEMKLMKTELSNLNARLDQFSVQFSEVKRKIEWSAMQLPFAKYERTIRVLNEQRLALANITDKAKFEFEKNRFIRNYESDWDEVSTRLYQAMITKTTLTNNIFHAAREYTQNHEPLTFEFIKGTIQLLIQAYSVDLAVFKLKHNDKDGQKYYEEQMQEKINKVQASALNVQTVIRNLSLTQVKKDVKNEAIKKKGSSNEHFVKHMYLYLEDKYPWREWFVLAFNKHGAKGDWRKHASHQCGGVRYINVGGRNIVVASVEKSVVTPFSKQWARKAISSIGKFEADDDYGERLVYKMLGHNHRTRCSPAALMAVVRRNDHREFVADAWIYTNRRRLNWQATCSPYKCNTGLCWVKKYKCFAAIMWG